MGLPTVVYAADRVCCQERHPAPENMNLTPLERIEPRSGSETRPITSHDY